MGDLLTNLIGELKNFEHSTEKPTGLRAVHQRRSAMWRGALTL